METKQIRISRAMHERIKKAAKKNGRKIISEVEKRLLETFKKQTKQRGEK